MGVFKAMNEVFDCMYTRPFAEDDALLNDYVDRIVHQVSWDMFEHQEEICYMINEKNPPMLKDEAIDYMRQRINARLSWIREYIVAKMLISYRLGNVDLGDEGDWYLKDELGTDEDGQYDEFEQAVRNYVYNDYVKAIGKEHADDYFKRIGREDWIVDG